MSVDSLPVSLGESVNLAGAGLVVMRGLNRRALFWQASSVGAGVQLAEE